MSEMNERVARAICSAYGGDPDAPFVDHHGKATDFPEWERWQGEAGAAIKAMREPTAEMLKATQDKIHEIGGEPDKMWRAMIDAARG